MDFDILPTMRRAQKILFLEARTIKNNHPLLDRKQAHTSSQQQLLAAVSYDEAKKVQLRASFLAQLGFCRIWLRSVWGCLKIYYHNRNSSACPPQGQPSLPPVLLQERSDTRICIVTENLQSRPTSIASLGLCRVSGIVGGRRQHVFASSTHHCRLRATGSNPQQLASGISIALYNTGFGLLVAIPALIFHRYFRGRVDDFVIEMEQLAIKLVEVVHGERAAK